MANSIRLLVLILALTSFAIARNRREFVSPDKMTRAIVYNFSENGRILESRVRVRNSKGALLFDKSFVSKDHRHGMGVVQAEWTANSQFFVFSMSSSGGHQPWHAFTFVFSVSTIELISIDKIVEPVTSPFKLFPPDSLEAIGFKTSIKEETKFALRLSTLIHKER